ncbi:MAG: hypothetical protein ACI3Y0_04580, partial [Prevotella sp.]
NVAGSDEPVVISLTTDITAISLWMTGENYDNAAGTNKQLSFISVKEQANTFPAEAGRVNETPFSFTEGYFRTTDSKLTIRVSPANAKVEADKIMLMDSQGKDLSSLITCTKVEAYDGLLVRSANPTGLYTLTFKLNDGYNADELKAATETKVNNVTKKILYSVAVKDNDACLVSSEWNVTLAAGNSTTAYDFKVNDKSINEIRNRYTQCEDGTSTAGVAELIWNVSTQQIPTPATTVVTSGDKKNATDRRDDIDKRQDKNILAVTVGQDIKIVYPTQNASGVYTPIKGFYVALDYAFALESAPSELNAWNSYEYDNVTKLDKDGNVIKAGTLFEGYEGIIRINSTAANNDVIGFRVFAVNLDGTLVDPDGRAFYVGVGNAATASLVEGSIVADKKTKPTSDFIATDAFVAGDYAAAWTVDANNPKYNNTASPAVTVLYYDKDKAETSDMSKVKFVKFQFADASQYIDGATYTQTINVTKTVGSVTYPVKTITAKITKVMPTAFPEEFSFRPKQEIEEGSGKFRAYMIPENGYKVTTASANGEKDLNNVFYGLDANYKFVIKDSKKNGNNFEDVEVTTASTAAPFEYSFSVANDPFIKSHTECPVVASYLYKNVSTKMVNNAWQVGVDYPVNYGKDLTIVYACWHDAETYAWGQKQVDTDDDGNPIYGSAQPQPKWTAEGNGYTSKLEYIVAKNSYNNDYFGGNLKDLIITKKWLDIAYNTDDNGTPTTPKIEMKYTDPTTGVVQTNPYFVPSIGGTNNDEIIFTQASVQLDAAPVADHVEQLIITVVDAYGHEYNISTDVTVKKPNTATAAKKR